jgi:hypothetical protein
MNRIQHKEIQAFKEKIKNTEFNGKPIGEWNRLFSSKSNSNLSSIFFNQIKISK